MSLEELGGVAPLKRSVGQCRPASVSLVATLSASVAGGKPEAPQVAVKTALEQLAHSGPAKFFAVRLLAPVVDGTPAAPLEVVGRHYPASF